jgi:hypothetical protein
MRVIEILNSYYHNEDFFEVYKKRITKIGIF